MPFATSLHVRVDLVGRGLSSFEPGVFVRCTAKLHEGEASRWGVVRSLVLGLLAVALTGCATIGPSVPKLSSHIGDRLAEMRALHEVTVRRLFDGERQRVDAFIDEKWTPAFLRNYLGNSGIVATVQARQTISSERELEIGVVLRDFLPQDTTEAPKAAHAVVVAIERERSPEPATIRRELDRFVSAERLEAATLQVSALLGTDDPARELIEWARSAEYEIRARRRALHAPIDEAEERTMAELAGAYDELAAAQSALTARVQAAAKLKELQDDGLRALGVQDRFEQAKQQALKVGAGVGKALSQMEKLDHSALLKGTVLEEILRDAITPVPLKADSVTTH